MFRVGAEASSRRRPSCIRQRRRRMGERNNKETHDQPLHSIRRMRSRRGAPEHPVGTLAGTRLAQGLAPTGRNILMTSHWLSKLLAATVAMSHSIRRPATHLRDNAHPRHIKTEVEKACFL
jgi:hypothetical protein